MQVFHDFPMRRKLLKIGTEGVPAASSFWKNVCIGLSFGARTITASSLSTGHPIHNRTIDAKYSAAVD
jgi:hypothetical protein